MSLKKKVLTTLSLVLILGLAALGILAYLMDDDSDVNVMTLGNVKIEQHEYERATNTAGSYETKEIDGVTSYVLKDFTQGKPLLPIVGDPNEPGNSPAYAGFDETIVRMTQVDSYGSMQVFAGKNAQDKFVTVENTGKSDAYVRTLVAIECGTGNTALIGTGNRGVAADQAASSTMPWIKHEIGKIVVDSNTYLLFEYVYRGASDVERHVNGILPAGDTTYPNLCQVYLKHNATNEDMVAIDGNSNGTLDILVFSQAGQVKGFEAVGAEKALDTMFYDVTTTNHPWVDGVEIPALVSDADSLIEALEKGEDVAMVEDVKIDPAGMSNAYGTTGINIKNGQTIDGDGHTLDIKGAGGTWDSGICTSGGLIKDLNVTGSFRGIFIKRNTHNERVVLENVTLDGVTYTVSVDSGTEEGLTATDSTFNGWTSYAGTLGDAKFINCNFGEGNGNAFCRPYAPTEFVGCEFEAGFQMDPRAKVTFENCTLDGVAITADNVGDLVKWNIDKVTVK